ncbi:hypothetical protein E3U43_005838 [Larimichthys crocea]|uniref:Uncharacterized protein n=1 Tax=Larimichthys crocea TaxID=215358 RepID=A0ACD3QME6_LARCR|nr:hypothetical protein E3U43_005838 [Larimichthys crocea]
MMMQELDDRLKEQIDKLEHVRLAAVELKDNLSGSNSDLTQSIAEHLEWLNHLSERVETVHMNTTVFVQMNPRFVHGQGNRVQNLATAWDVSTRLRMPSQSLAGPRFARDETATLPLRCPVTGDL